MPTRAGRAKLIPPDPFHYCLVQSHAMAGTLAGRGDPMRARQAHILAGPAADDLNSRSALALAGQCR